MANVQYYVSYLIVLIFWLDAFAMAFKDYTSLTNKVCQSKKQNDTNLRFVSVLFRHGDAVVSPLPNGYYLIDPFECDSCSPFRIHILNKAGKGRAYELGKFLKKRYDSFLGNVYYPPNVYARSTAYAKTKMTLQIVLAALYPPVDIRQKWHPKLAWQPFDINFSPIKQDGLLLPFLCSRFEESIKQILKMKYAEQLITYYNVSMVTMSSFTGLNITSLKACYIFYHLLDMYSTDGAEFPNWPQDDYNLWINDFRSASVAYYETCSFNQWMKQINGGTILYKILQDMHEIVKGNLPDKRINLFAGHDMNVAAVLLALGIYNKQVPQYTSGVIIELYEIDGKYFVQVLHYLGIPPVLIKTSINGCSELCPFNKYVQLISNVLGFDDPECPV